MATTQFVERLPRSPQCVLGLPEPHDRPGKSSLPTSDRTLTPIWQLVSQYYVIQKRYFKIPDLYIGDKRSIYWYTYGINWRAFVAFFSGVAPCITGFVGSVSNHEVSAAAIQIYDLNYMVGFGISFLINWALHVIFPVWEQREFVKRMEELGAPKHIDGIMEYLEDPDAKSAIDAYAVEVIEEMVSEEKSHIRS